MLPSLYHKWAMKTFGAATVVIYPRWIGAKAEINSPFPVPSVCQTAEAGQGHPPSRLVIAKNEATEPEQQIKELREGGLS